MQVGKDKINTYDGAFVEVTNYSLMKGSLHLPTPMKELLNRNEVALFGIIHHALLCHTLRKERASYP